MSIFSASASLIDNTIYLNIWDLETIKSMLDVSFSNSFMGVTYIVSKIKQSISDRIIVVSLMSVFNPKIRDK